jgi:thymidine kinase
MFLEDFPDKEGKRGWIEVVCGSMFSGKTEELLRRVKRAQIAGQNIAIFKPEIDTRYSEMEVVSHDSNNISAISVANPEDILKMASLAKVVAIDEVQFFDERVVDVCNKLASSGKRVIVAGLDMDYLGKPFVPMPQLLAVAEYITKVHAICMSCGQLASFSHRISLDEEQVVLGEKDKYEPLCRVCFDKIEH